MDQEVRYVLAVTFSENEKFVSRTFSSLSKMKVENLSFLGIVVRSVVVSLFKDKTRTFSLSRGCLVTFNELDNVYEIPLYIHCRTSSHQKETKVFEELIEQLVNNPDWSEVENSK